jgi:type I restriction enzyme M protein
MAKEESYATIPEDSVVDFIDGALRKKTPEEYVRQNVERSLVQEYRYLREEIKVEFPIKVGSSRKKVDLAVFLEGRPQVQENVVMILECKREGSSPSDKTEGVEQLKSYMAACVNSKFGIWTNGSDERLCFVKESSDDIVAFAEIVDVPLKGDILKESEAPSRQKLRAAAGDNLLLAFKRCHNYIAGNQGLQKPEAFWELLKVIFCKIEDERSLEPLAFYITTKEQRSPDGQLKAKKRIDGLFAEVLDKYPLIFKSTEQIELNRTVLGYLVSQLQNYSLLESPVDVKGIAYEEIVGSNLRGDRGEFFTPRNACKMAVELLSPNPGSRFIDPACGTGGFLVTAMNAVLEKFDEKAKKRWRRKEAPTEQESAEFYRGRRELMESSVVGLDINPNLVRASKMNMVMNNDGSGGLFQADSLKDPITWAQETRQKARLGTFDYLFTNPPFGTNIRIDSQEVLGQFELACQWDFDETEMRWTKKLKSDQTPVLQGSQPPEILFIERALQFLKPGVGLMAMVIPNGILNNPPLGYVRQWMLKNAQILAVVDMQRDLFQPRNDTQTSMVFMRRKSEAEKQKKKDYQIFMAVTDKIGHDKRGNAIYKRDLDGRDILVTRRTKAKLVEDGQLIEKVIEEKGPVIDDQLPEIPNLYKQWVREHGI